MKEKKHFPHTNFLQMKLENWNVICDIRVPVSLFFQSFHFLSIWSKKKKKKSVSTDSGAEKKESSPLFKATVKVSHTDRDATVETRKLGETLVQ